MKFPARRFRPSIRFLIIGAWLWTAGLHIALWILEFRGRALWGDENRYMDSAQALLNGSPAWWPEAFWPPLQSQVLSGLVAIGAKRVLLIGLFQTFLLVVAALVLGDLIRRWSASSRAGLFGVWLCLSYPPLVAFTHYLWPEVLHLSLFLMAIWMLCVHWESKAWNLLTGVVLGLALLTKSLLGPLIPLLLLGAFWRREKALRNAALVVLTLLLTISPVLWAQYHRLGRPMIADSSAFNLWVGLNDRGLKNFEDEYVARAYEEYRCAAGNFFQKNTELRRRSYARIREQGLVATLKSQLFRQYFRLFDKENYLGEQLLEGAAVKMGLGYRDRSSQIAGLLRVSSFLFYAVLLALFPASLLLYPWKDRRWLRLMLLFLGYNLALFFCFHVKSRYRIQLLPVLFMAAPLLSAILFGLEGRLLRGGRLRRVLAVALGALGLFLGFGGPLLK